MRLSITSWPMPLLVIFVLWIMVFLVFSRTIVVFLLRSGSWVMPLLFFMLLLGIRMRASFWRFLINNLAFLATSTLFRALRPDSFFFFAFFLSLFFSWLFPFLFLRKKLDLSYSFKTMWIIWFNFWFSTNFYFAFIKAESNSYFYSRRLLIIPFDFLQQHLKLCRC